MSDDILVIPKSVQFEDFSWVQWLIVCTFTKIYTKNEKKN